MKNYRMNNKQVSATLTGKAKREVKDNIALKRGMTTGHITTIILLIIFCIAAAVTGTVILINTQTGQPFSELKSAVDTLRNCESFTIDMKLTINNADAELKYERLTTNDYTYARISETMSHRLYLVKYDDRNKRYEFTDCQQTNITFPSECDYFRTGLSEALITCAHDLDEQSPEIEATKKLDSYVNMEAFDESIKNLTTRLDDPGTLKSTLSYNRVSGEHIFEFDMSELSVIVCEELEPLLTEESVDIIKSLNGKCTLKYKLSDDGTPSTLDFYADNAVQVKTTFTNINSTDIKLSSAEKSALKKVQDIPVYTENIKERNAFQDAKAIMNSMKEYKNGTLPEGTVFEVSKYGNEYIFIYSAQKSELCSSNDSYRADFEKNKNKGNIYTKGQKHGNVTVYKEKKK